MIRSGRKVARIEDVRQRYGAAVALDGVTIELPADSLVGFIGPDGVGKSTLLSIIAGARRVQSGKAFVLDSGPVAKLLKLNGHGEIPVEPNQSTTVPGFFAAGDVTDTPDKQIVIAAG